MQWLLALHLHSDWQAMIRQTSGWQYSLQNVCEILPGVNLHQTLSMQDQIGSICRVSFKRIRMRCVHLTVSFKRHFNKAGRRFDNLPPDYCNSVLAGLPAEQTGRLQRVQISAARLVLKKRKQDHITRL